MKSFRWILAASALALAFLPVLPAIAPEASASPAGCNAVVRFMCADVDVWFSGRVCMTSWDPDCRFDIAYFMSCSTTVAGGGRCTLVPTHSTPVSCTWGSAEFGCSISHSDGFASDSPNHAVVATGNGLHNLGFADTDAEEACIETPGAGFC